jgi:hypothetical protein
MVLNASYVCLHVFSLRRESPDQDPRKWTGWFCHITPRCRVGYKRCGSLLAPPFLLCATFCLTRSSHNPLTPCLLSELVARAAVVNSSQWAPPVPPPLLLSDRASPSPFYLGPTGGHRCYRGSPEVVAIIEALPPHLCLPPHWRPAATVSCRPTTLARRVILSTLILVPPELEDLLAWVNVNHCADTEVRACSAASVGVGRAGLLGRWA